MKYAYYPGCSLEKNAAAYGESFTAVADVLAQELVEIPDWNCCGATEYFSLDPLPAYALLARNLALVPKGLTDLVAPCSACYLNLYKTEHHMAERPQLNRDVNTALAEANLSYKPGTVRVRHALDILVKDVGYEANRRSRQAAAARLAARAVLWLPGRATGRTRLLRPRVSRCARPAVGGAGSDGGGLSAQSGLLRRPHAPDQSRDGLWLDLRADRVCRLTRGRRHRHALPDVPTEPGCVPGPGQRPLWHSSFDAGFVFYPDDGTGFWAVASGDGVRPRICVGAATLGQAGLAAATA